MNIQIFKYSIKKEYTHMREPDCHAYDVARHETHIITKPV